MHSLIGNPRDPPIIYILRSPMLPIILIFNNSLIISNIINNIIYS